jgi:uncharacterized protein (TIRG00374 family)
VRRRADGRRTIRNDLIKLVAGFLLAALLLWWVLRDTNLQEVLHHLGQASILWIVVATVLNLGHNVFRVWRWRALLAPERAAVPFRPMFAAVIVGYMTSWAIPGRIGELVRPMLLAQRERLPLGPCIGSVVADRVLDGVTVVALFALGAWLTPLEGAAAENAGLIRSGALTLLVAAVLFVVLMLGVSSARSPVEGWLERRGRTVRWIGHSVLSVSSGVNALRSPRLLLLVLLHSFLAWGTISLGTWAMVWSVGVRVSLGAILFIMPILVLGVAVPTPGGAGSYHGAMKVGLLLFAVGDSLAASAAIVAHLIILVPTILLGMVLIWTERISWREMVSAARGFKSLGEGPRRSGATAGETLESLP